MTKPQVDPLSDERPDLQASLFGYWAANAWLYADCPLLTQAEHAKLANRKGVKLNKPIVFDCQSANLNLELKFACYTKLVSKEWAVTTLWVRNSTIRYLTDWLNVSEPQMQSLMDRTLEECLESFRDYLIERGKFGKGMSPPRLGKDQQFRQYEHENNYIVSLRSLYRVLDQVYHPRTQYDQEVWDLRTMGATVDLSKSSYRINFARITQPWLLDATKRFVEYSVPLYSIGECQTRASTLRDFSCFLSNHYPTLAPQELSRPIVLEFIRQLAKTGLTGATRYHDVRVLRTFLEFCVREGWADIPDKQFIYDDDFPDIEQPMPRFIPDEVLHQLNQFIEDLPPTVMRMTLVIEETGLRIGNLCGLPFDPLIRDVQGDYFLRFRQSKLKKDHTVPITKEIAGVIQEQQQVVRQLWGDDFPYLFPNDKGKPFQQKTFTDALNRLAVEKNIRSAAGVLWRFQAHQFRHTCGTSMINNGVAQHIVQRFLGHVSPQMTARYAFIFDQTLKGEFLKFKHRVVDVTGRAISPQEAGISDGTDPNAEDEQWLKQNVMAQALPTGSCGLPAVQKRCPHGANRCLTGSDGEGCPHFSTDIRFLTQHQEQLERTNKIVAWAEENPLSRRAQDILTENLPVKRNLERIIEGLTINSEDSDESSTEH